MTQKTKKSKNANGADGVVSVVRYYKFTGKDFETFDYTGKESQDDVIIDDDGGIWVKKEGEDYKGYSYTEFTAFIYTNKKDALFGYLEFVEGEIKHLEGVMKDTEDSIRVFRDKELRCRELLKEIM